MTKPNDEMTDLEKFFVVAWTACKNLETELLAHVETIKAIQAAMPERAAQISKALADARKHPNLAELMYQKYDVTLATWLRQETLAAQMREALRMLESTPLRDAKRPQ
jgi:hypothetical protein